MADVHFEKGYIEIPKPKGGKERAFRVPISKPMRRSLERAIKAGAPFRDRFPHCEPWVFPSAASRSGHVTEPASQKRGIRPTTYAVHLSCSTALASWTPMPMC